MKILFLSRAYPPTVGGIENQNYELSVWLPKHAEVKTIANTHGKIFLPVFLIYATIKSLFIARKYDAILLGDGVLGVIGWKLKIFTHKPVICIVHGLDLTFKNFLYQKLWVGFFLKKMDKFIAVGNETVKVAVEKGLPQEKVVFIPNGVDTEKFIGEYSRNDLEKILDEKLEDKKVLLTSGRLAKRKGVAWFIRNVMPKLGSDIIYAVSGDGPDRENIEKAIKDMKLEKKVKMLGYVRDEERNILLNTTDLFIQPNIKVEGDIEGFGISVIEAGSCKLPVVASRIEGLQDAIKNEKNGILIEPMNIDMFVEKINNLLSNDEARKEFGERVRQFVIDNYRWEIISKKYFEEIKKVVNV